MGTGEFNAGGNPASYPIEIFLVASCYGSRVKLWSGELHGSYADLTFITREVKHGWDLDHILDVFRSELEARERANGNNVSPTDQSSCQFSHNRGCNGLPLPTDAALIATRCKPTYTYCQKDHATIACKNVASIAARRDILKRAGRCYVCLKRNHMSKDCSSRMKCLKCGRQHHTSICMSNTNDEVKCLHSATVERSASLPQSQTSSSLPRESNWRPRDKTYAKSVLGT